MKRLVLRMEDLNLNEKVLFKLVQRGERKYFKKDGEEYTMEELIIIEEGE